MLITSVCAGTLPATTSCTVECKGGVRGSAGNEGRETGEKIAGTKMPLAGIDEGFGTVLADCPPYIVFAITFKFFFLFFIR